MTPSDNPATNLVMEIHHKLCNLYGDPPHQPDGDPLAALVNTILSQNTNDRNRDIAFAALRARFPTWEAVRDAPVEAVIDAIRPAGLAPTKGPNIQGRCGRLRQSVARHLMARYRSLFWRRCRWKTLASGSRSSTGLAPKPRPSFYCSRWGVRLSRSIPTSIALAGGLG